MPESAQVMVGSEAVVAETPHRSARRRGDRARARRDQGRGGEAHHRPAGGHRPAAHGAVRARPLPVRRRARAWPRRCSSRRSPRCSNLSFNRIQFTPDLMPSDITGTDVLEEDHATGKRVVPLHPRAAVRQHRARRRDQPHAAEDAGGAAAGDAGAARDRGRTDPRAAAAVPRVRHAESDRAGGHLSAARGAARSLHVPGRRRLSVERRKRSRSSSSRRAPIGRRSRRCCRPSGSWRCRSWCCACRSPITWCSYAVALVRATRPPRSRRCAFVKRERRLRRRSARVAVPHPRRQGASAILDGRPAASDRGRARAGAADAAAPPDHQLPRRGGRHPPARDRRSAARERPAVSGARSACRDPRPALARALQNLELRARTVVEGALSGLHRSPHHGSSVEFAEHKEYSRRRRDQAHRLEGVRQVRQVLRQALRGRDASCARTCSSTARRRWATRRQRRVQARVRAHAGGVARLPVVAAAGSSRAWSPSASGCAAICRRARARAT